MYCNSINISIISVFARNYVLMNLERKLTYVPYQHHINLPSQPMTRLHHINTPHQCIRTRLHHINLPGYACTTSIYQDTLAAIYHHSHINLPSISMTRMYHITSHQPIITPNNMQSISSTSIFCRCYPWSR